MICPRDGTELIPLGKNGKDISYHCITCKQYWFEKQLTRVSTYNPITKDLMEKKQRKEANKVCGFCGWILLDSPRYCENCGHRLRS